MDISNTADVIDSRDIIERINELRYAEPGTLDSDEWDELKSLAAVEDQAEGYGDWEHGETLIHESYFTEYTRDLLTECGYLPADLPRWITIDWEDTADNVKADYMEIDFDGQTFFMRA